MLDLEFPGFMTNPKRSVPESSCRPESKKEICCQSQCYLMEEKSFRSSNVSCWLLTWKILPSILGYCNRF